MKRLASLLIIIAALSAVTIAQRTTRTGLKTADTENSLAKTPIAQLVFDTIVSPPLSNVEVSGYDKPLRSRRETFFVTNSGENDIAEIAFTITYYDTSRRMLHKASHRVSADIPASQTRQVSLRAWDAQQAFYYIRSPKPERVQQATPYEITLTVDTIFVK